MTLRPRTYHALHYEEGSDDLSGNIFEFSLDSSWYSATALKKTSAFDGEKLRNRAPLWKKSNWRISIGTTFHYLQPFFNYLLGQNAGIFPRHASRYFVWIILLHRIFGCNRNTLLPGDIHSCQTGTLHWRHHCFKDPLPSRTTSLGPVTVTHVSSPIDSPPSLRQACNQPWSHGDFQNDGHASFSDLSVVIRTWEGHYLGLHVRLFAITRKCYVSLLFSFKS